MGQRLVGAAVPLPVSCSDAEREDLRYSVGRSGKVGER